MDFDPVEHVVAAAVGEPGARAFYLQCRKGANVVSMLLEKTQVALLTTHIDELLERVGVPDEETATDAGSLDLEEPVVPDFRIGRIGLGYDEERDLVLLQCDEYVPVDEYDEEGADLPENDDLGRVRVWATRGQMFALARRGESEVAGGRPICGMCGQSIDPEGHFCPRSNGHREVTRLA
jgi:uncharacterized repeat protein (TIGR03847 family)